MAENKNQKEFEESLSQMSSSLKAMTGQLKTGKDNIQSGFSELTGGGGPLSALVSELKGLTDKVKAVGQIAKGFGQIIASPGAAIKDAVGLGKNEAETTAEASQKTAKNTDELKEQAEETNESLKKLLGTNKEILDKDTTSPLLSGSLFANTIGNLTRTVTDLVPGLGVLLPLAIGGYIFDRFAKFTGLKTGEVKTLADTLKDGNDETTVNRRSDSLARGIVNQIKDTLFFTATGSYPTLSVENRTKVGKLAREEEEKKIAEEKRKLEEEKKAKQRADAQKFLDDAKMQDAKTNLTLAKVEGKTEYFNPSLGRMVDMKDPLEMALADINEKYGVGSGRMDSAQDISRVGEIMENLTYLGGGDKSLFNTGFDSKGFNLSRFDPDSPNFRKDFGFNNFGSVFKPDGSFVSNFASSATDADTLLMQLSNLLLQKGTVSQSYGGFFDTLTDAKNTPGYRVDVDPKTNKPYVVKEGDGPKKKDGTPDKRFKNNKSESFKLKVKTRFNNILTGIVRRGFGAVLAFDVISQLEAMGLDREQQLIAIEVMLQDGLITKEEYNNIMKFLDAKYLDDRMFAGIKSTSTYVVGTRAFQLGASAEVKSLTKVKPSDFTTIKGILGNVRRNPGSLILSPLLRGTVTSVVAVALMDTLLTILDETDPFVRMQMFVAMSDEDFNNTMAVLQSMGVFMQQKEFKDYMMDVQQMRLQMKQIETIEAGHDALLSKKDIKGIDFQGKAFKLGDASMYTKSKLAIDSSLGTAGNRFVIKNEATGEEFIYFDGLIYPISQESELISKLDEVGYDEFRIKQNQRLQKALKDGDISLLTPDIFEAQKNRNLQKNYAPTGEGNIFAPTTTNVDATTFNNYSENSLMDGYFQSSNYSPIKIN